MDKVIVSVGLTKNLGNYESARVDATLETDVEPTETTDEAFARAWLKVKEQVSAQLDD